MRRIAVLIALTLIQCIGCTHANYRSIVMGGGIAAQAIDTRQTVTAMGNGESETHPLFGHHPGTTLLVSGAAISVGAMVGWHVLIERMADRGPETEWVKDVAATLPMLVEGYCVWHNTMVVGEDWRKW
jgi:hypothetical protein